MQPFDELRANGLGVDCLDGFIGAHRFAYRPLTVRGEPLEPQRLKAP